MLVGDAAYPLQPWLLTPYTGAITPSQQRFNFHLNSAHTCIEKAFEKLKGRWSYLTQCSDMSADIGAKVIVACAILHNFCEKQKEHYQSSWSEAKKSQTSYTQPNEIICTNIIPDEYFDPKGIRESLRVYLEKKNKN